MRSNLTEDFSVKKIAWIMLVAAFLCGTSQLEAADAKKPNIVILYADDMGWGDLGVQNPQSKIPTPHLDRLAREGTRFTNAHSSSGICTPSRYALLEGRYHWRKFHGIVNSFDQPVLDDEKTTLAELLKTTGYQTACIGKWHLGWDWNAIKRAGSKNEEKGKGFAPDAFDWSKSIPGGPLSHGFDYYFGDDVPNFPPYAWFENDRVITEPTVRLTTTKPTAEGSWEARPGPAVKDWDFWAVMPMLTEKAVDWIGKRKPDEPFFLYFPFTSPHAPIVPTSAFQGKSQAGGYGDFVAQTDATVGRVLEALETGGFAENTLVIFSADNGPEGYAYERVKKFNHRSMGPLRGLKRDLWEGGHCVPFVVRWPQIVPAGRVSDDLLSQIDLFATIAAVVGADIPAGSGEDSYDQLSLFRGNSSSARDTLVHNTNPNGYALRHGDWVLIEAKSGGVTGVPPWFDEANGYAKNTQPGELYNLRDDLGQKKNLYAEMPEKVAELKERLQSIRVQGQVR
jgi:arylsulfatase A